MTGVQPENHEVKYWTRSPARDYDNYYATPSFSCVDLRGTREQIKAYLESLHPSPRDCRQVEDSKFNTDNILVWRIPNYIGNDEDVVLYYLKKYGRVRTASSLGQSLSRQFTKISCSSHGDNTVTCELGAPTRAARHAVLKRRREAVSRRRQKRGEVYAFDVTGLFYAMLRTLDEQLDPSYVRVRVWPRTGFKYMEHTIKVYPLIQRTGGIRKVRTNPYFSRLAPFLSGLLKHSNSVYRAYGRMLRKCLKEKRKRRKEQTCATRRCSRKTA